MREYASRVRRSTDMTTSTLTRADYIVARTIATIAAATHANGGATVDPFTASPVTNGYAVALHGFERIVPDDARLEAEIHRFVDDHLATLLLPGHFLGTWVHEGKVYLDVTEVVSCRQEAVSLGRERHEIAVYDLAAGEEVQVA